MAHRLYRVLGGGLLVAMLTCCAAEPAVPATKPSLALERPEPDSGAAPSTREGTSKPSPTEAAPNSDFSMTIYSTAAPATFSPQEALEQAVLVRGQRIGPPGYGVVREVRSMSLNAGINRVEFPDVASGIDPTTVAFRSLTAPDTTTVLEQNFEFDLASADKLIDRYLGKSITLVLKQPEGASDNAPRELTGILESYDPNSYGAPSYVIRTSGGPHPVIVQRGDGVDSVLLAGADGGLVSKPTLNWKISAAQAGKHDVQVTYQTDGLTWRADYNVVLSRDDSSADLSAWVTVLNASGLTFPDAKIKLIAGDVQRVESQQPRNNVYNNGTGQQNAGADSRGFFEYHLYTLGRPTTVSNNSTKQIELFPAKANIKVDKVFLYYGLSGNERYFVAPTPVVDNQLATESNRKVDVYVRFMNSEANHLGVPLPAGRARLYKVDEADGNREFVGEDVIEHTAKNEEVLLRAGSAFDLVGERKQTDFNLNLPEKMITEKFAITLRNHKKDPVQVIVKENMYRWVNWEIVESSDKWTKPDFRTVHFKVDVPADGEKKVTYTVRYRW